MNKGHLEKWAWRPAKVGWEIEINGKWYDGIAKGETVEAIGDAHNALLTTGFPLNVRMALEGYAIDRDNAACAAFQKCAEFVKAEHLRLGESNYSGAIEALMNCHTQFSEWARQAEPGAATDTDTQE